MLRPLPRGSRLVGLPQLLLKFARSRRSRLRNRFQSSRKIVTLHEKRRPDGRVESVRQLAEDWAIEPLFGYPVNGGVVYEDAMTPHKIHHHPAWRVGFPRRTRPRPHELSEEYHHVISLRHFWEWNYFHFYFDVLAKLQLLEDLSLDPDAFCLLGPYVNELPWAQQIIGQGNLAARRWKIADPGEFVQADIITVPRTARSFGERAGFLATELGLRAEPGGSEMLCIGREDTSTRRITNQSEVFDVARGFGFEPVPGLSHMTVREQLLLFRQSRCVVAIHGAGLANVLGRVGHPFSLLELHPSGFMSPDFRSICHHFRWTHRSLSGRPRQPDLPRADFAVDLDQLQMELAELVADDPFTPGD